VKNVILTEYNKELHLKTTREEGIEEGKLEKEEEIAVKMIKRGDSDESIREIIGYTQEQLDELRKRAMGTLPSK